MIKKVVIPAAGRGTRLLPATKENPKEMLPIYSRNSNGVIIIKPIIHFIFEQFSDYGLKEFCFIVGRGKGNIINHFTSNLEYQQLLDKMGKKDLALILSELSKKITSVSINFINQPEPKGFGDAVLRAQPFIREDFFVQAGDTLILSKNNNHLKTLEKTHKKFKSDATLYVQKVDDPKQFGVVQGDEITKGILEIEKLTEKPKNYVSNLAITALYIFSPKIFQALSSIKRESREEIQLTDGIQKLIEMDYKVIAQVLGNEDKWLDIGNPQSYYNSLVESYNFFKNV